MKKTAIAGIFLILVMMFAVTCDDELSVGEEIVYTNVEYSQDRSTITLYVDGTKPVPVTKADRAVNKGIATMVFDYFEVIFIGASTSDLARTAWELGESAGISDLPRVVYANTSATANSAIMFVGKKSDKTLLGVGKLTNVDNANPASTTVTAGTRSVTFSIAAIQTGLLIYNESTTSNPDVVADSFTYASTNTTPSGYAAKSATNTARVTLGGIEYPSFSLPENNTSTPVNIDMTYTFSFVGGGNYTEFIRHINGTTTDKPLVQRRTPRYMEGGRYREPKQRWTTTCKVDFNPITYGADGGAFNPAVPLRFNPKGSGVFSFYLQIPVYMCDQAVSSYSVGDIGFQKWYIRTGVGSELYSLDDGVTNGGCVLMSIGASGTNNWVDIEWQWL